MVLGGSATPLAGSTVTGLPLVSNARDTWPLLLMGRTADEVNVCYATLTSNLEAIGSGQATRPLDALIRSSFAQHWCRSLPTEELSTFCCPAPGPGWNFQLPTSAVATG